ncbi:MAG: dTDP-4-dehydrorhamnose reductase [Candidatus Omnitrophica bacterium]|nr:dTDP-4-dehydrorhamnose reductase [Candidatus Omnitrophota bacterium]
MKRRILITGSSGMLGVDLSRELKKDSEVIGMDLVDSSQLTVDRFFKGDVTDEKSVAAVFKEVKPGIVIHAAAMTDVDGCETDKDKAYKINAAVAANVAKACARTDSVLIYISTDFVFDGKNKEPYREGDKPNPLSVYGDSKLKGEEAVIKNLKKYFILRTGWLYCANGKNFVDTILAKAKTEKILKVVDDQVGSPTYTKDLAKAMRVLIDKISSQLTVDSSQDCGIYHVSNSGSVSWFEYAREILRLAGSGAKIIPISSGELNRPARRPAMSVLDNSKFIKFTGYEIRNWKDALKEYIFERKGK